MVWISSLRKPAFVMCPPIYLSNKIKNNKWMEEDNSTINVGRALFQWNNLYELMTTDAIVYLLAPNPNLQDQTFINSFVVLAHRPDVAILSNFRARGRAGEEREVAGLLTRLGFKVYQAPPYFEGWPECYDEKTEILTYTGWKKFNELSPQDRVMVYNPKTDTLYWSKYIRFIKRYHKGPIIHIGNKLLDILVTPGHNSFWRPMYPGSSYRLTRSDEMPRNCYIKITGIFDGPKPEFIEIKNKWGALRFPAEQWMELLGWYLSEGSLSEFVIQLAQSPRANPEKYEEIYELVKAVGFKPYRCCMGIHFRSKILAEYFRQFGTCGDKYIPTEFKNLHPDLLEHLIDALIKGDGSWKRRFTTKSKRLADDFQEIALKCGYRTTLTVYYKHDEDRLYKWYDVSLNPRREVCVHSSWSRIEIINYEGWVYDVEVPKDHILLVRRNGHPFLSGNCKWLHDNIYVAGYGERSTLKTQQFLAEAFDYKIIPVKTSPYLYHLDCLFFKLSDEYAIVAVDDIPKEAVKAISREIEILPADHNDTMQGICNSIRLRRIVINASNVDELEGEDKKIEVAKNEKLEQYAELAGMEVVFVNLSEFLKSGALASCLVAPLNYRHEE